jgi:tripartite-type tricarboxylate transporter receptor subunit TctC
MDSKILRRTLLAAAAAAAAGLAIPAAAQVATSRPITIVVPYPPGGSADIAARILGKGLAVRLGQPVVIENKAGAGTVLGASAVAQAEPDGHTLLFTSNTTYTISPALNSKLPYDPIKSFVAIGVVGSSPLVLLAHPSVQASTVPQLVALARANPGKLNYASFGNATISHFAGEMFKAMAEVDIVHVPYKGSAAAMQDLIRGQVQLSFDVLVAAKQQVEAGRVKAIAVTSRKRSSFMPNIVTLGEAGYPDYEMVSWAALLAPRGLSEDVRKRLVSALADTVADPDTSAELTKAGVEVAYEPPASYEQRVLRESPWIRRAVQQTGMTVD